MRKVLIGTPCYDGRIDVWYANSLVNTIKESVKHDIEILPIWVSFDALVQRARNDTVKIAKDLDVDDLFFIDSDIEWNTDHFFKILNSPHDVIGGTYPKKGDKEEYVLRQYKGLNPIDPVTGLLEVSGLGTGFVKLSKKAYTYLWDTSEMYIDPKDDQERRMVFDVAIIDKSLHSEDINMFNKLIAGNFKIYLDSKITCNHSGPKKFVGDFEKWYKKLLFNLKNPIRKQL